MPPPKPPKPNKPSSARSRSAELRQLEELAKEGDFLDRQRQEEEDTKPTQARQRGRIRSAPEQELGKRVQQVRESRRMTQGELSELTKSLDDEEKGISRAVISLYEAGTNRPSPKEIRLLCEALQITPNFLIYGDDEPFHPTNNYERLGTRGRASNPETYAWLAYVMGSIHHNHYDAVMKLVLDLARAWDKSFDQGLQERANERLLAMAAELEASLRRHQKQIPPSPSK